MPRKLQRLSLPILPDAPWLLDLFCCAGGAGMGYYRAGFNVVGVDIEPQPHYPFTFIQADALDVLAGLIAEIKLGVFSVIHASPPCQARSDLQKQSKRYYEEFVPRTRALLITTGKPYVIENVEGETDDPEAALINPVKLCGASSEFPDVRVIRHRLFESNVALVGTDCPKPRHPLVFTYDKRKPHYGKLDQNVSYVQVTGGGNCTVANKRDAMGTTWMTGDECNEAIPPAYTEYLGRQLLSHITTTRGAIHHMSDTHNAHLATDRHAARGHTRRKLRTMEERAHKTAKAARKSTRSDLREQGKLYR